MKPLPLRPLPIPSESLSDFLDRLANANGYHARELWGILDRGTYAHDQLLSRALNGHVLPNFSGPAIPRVDIPVESFGLRSSDFTRTFRRWCPICIESAAWLRPIWRLKVATVCSVHGVHLLQDCPFCKQRVNIQSILRGSCDCGVRFMQVVKLAPHKHVQIAWTLEESLMGRAILGVGDLSFALSAKQVVRLICYGGRLAEGPRLARPGQVGQLEELGTAARLVEGLSKLLADWPNAFWRCLEQFVAASPGDASVRRVFGPLFHVIYKDLREPEFKFLRDAFELFLLDHWRGELCGRHRLFQQETILAHRNEGLTRVARMAGVGRETLKRLVHNEGVPANRFSVPSKREWITIDRTQLAQFIPDPADYLDMRSAARFLGIERTRLRLLVATGAIVADAKPVWKRSNRWHFRRSEISGFMDRIRRTAMTELNEATTITLNHVLQFFRISAVELDLLLTSMKQGDVPFTLASGGNLREVTFGESGIRHWLEQLRRSTSSWVSVTAAAELLGLKEQVVYELVSKTLIAAELTQKKGKIFKRISLSSLEQFRKQYVSLAELARQRKSSASALLKHLDAKPVIGPKIDGGRQYFYRRADLAYERDLMS